MNGCSARPCGVAGGAAVVAARQLRAPERDRRPARSASAAPRLSSTASSTARQKSQTAMIARRCSARQHEKRVVEARLARHQAARASSARRARAARGTSRDAERRPALQQLGARRARRARGSRMPPSQVKRSSSRSRPRTPSQTARPSSKRVARHVDAAPRARRVHAGVMRPARQVASLAPHASCTSRGTYSRPARQSRPKSCQKFVSCSAVHSASDDRSSAVVAIAGDAQHEPADRIRRSAAVVEHVGPRGVASRHGILTERAHEIVEQRHRQIERPNRMRERDDDQIVVLVRRRAGRVDRDAPRAGGAATRRAAPAARRPAPSPSSAMSSATRANAYTAATCGRIGARQQPRRDGKILVVRPRQRLARRVRATSATSDDGRAMGEA